MTDQPEDQPIVLPVSKFAEGGPVPNDPGEHGDSVPVFLDNGYVVPKLVVPKLDPDVEVSVEPQADVRFISDGDSGAAGESSG